MCIRLLEADKIRAEELEIFKDGRVGAHLLTGGLTLYPQSGKPIAGVQLYAGRDNSQLILSRENGLNPTAVGLVVKLTVRSAA